MTLRSRSRTATVTSGPGRGPSSDGRTRHRRPSRVHGRTRHRRAPEEELRRRARVLFADRAGERPGPVTGPPPGGPAVAAHPTGEERETPGTRAPEGLAGTAGAEGATTGGGWRERAGPALRERMPMWLQTRCGLERRSVIALTVVLVAAAAFALQHFWAGRTQPVSAPEMVRAAAPYGEPDRDAAPGLADPGSGAPKDTAGAVAGAAAGATGGAEIVVDVSGKVREPGIHRLPAGSRVVDALRAAGGVRPGTDTTALNRARCLVDGEQVVVGGPAPGPGAGAGAPVAGGPAGTGAGVPAAPLSLNTATAGQLETLPGVGPVLARHIVDYRTRHGGFRSVDELREVNGIGERRFADLRNLVRP